MSRPARGGRGFPQGSQGPKGSQGPASVATQTLTKGVKAGAKAGLNVALGAVSGGTATAIKTLLWLKGRGLVFKLALTMGLAVVAATVCLIIAVVSATVGIVASLQPDDCTGGGSNPRDPSGYVNLSNPSGYAQDQIPPEYLKAYQAAGKRYGLDWAILAGIGYHESKHDNGGTTPCTPNNGGGAATGTMQIMPETFAAEGVSADGGTPDICNFRDNIMTGAHILKDDGAPEDYDGALYKYGGYATGGPGWEEYHSTVMEMAAKYRANDGGGGGSGGGGSTDKKSAPKGEEKAQEKGGGRSGTLEGVLGSVLASREAGAALLGGPLGEAGSSLVGGGLRSVGEAGSSSLVAGLAPSEASAEQEDWTLVDSNRNLYYEDHSSYSGAVSHAADAWQPLGSVNVAPSPDSSKTDVQIADTSLDAGIMAYTYSDGKMLLNPDNLSIATENAQNSTVTHEMGHALGFDHHYGDPSIMNTPVIYNSSSNIDAPTDYDKEQYYARWGHQPAAGSGDSVKPTKDGPGGAGGGGEKAVFPLDKQYMDKFSDDFKEGSHEGVDLPAQQGASVYSITSGKVVEPKDTMGGYAVMIEATADVGPVKKGDTLFYANLAEASPVKVGDTVKAGDKIGAVGTSATDDGGVGGEPHLHLGWYDPSGQRANTATKAMNPYTLLKLLKENDGTLMDGGKGMAPGPCPRPGGGSGGGGHGPSAGGITKPGSGQVQDLLDDKNCDMWPQARQDLEDNIVDGRLIAAVQSVCEKHTVTIPWFKTGHSFDGSGHDGPYIDSGYGAAGGLVNTHYFGRAADIFVVDGIGQFYGPGISGHGSDGPVVDVGTIMLGLPPDKRPDQMIGSADWEAALNATREQGFITDGDQVALHHDHIHLGFMKESGTNNTQ